jgi:hypothetical protein
MLPVNDDNLAAFVGETAALSYRVVGNSEVGIFGKVGNKPLYGRDLASLKNSRFC